MGLQPLLAGRRRAAHNRARGTGELMPAKSVVMAFVLSGWLIALVMAGLIVAYTSFFGLAVLGVVVWCFSVIVDQDRDGAVGTGMTPGFLARQFKARAEMSHGQRLALRQEHALEGQSTRLFRYLGVVMTLVGLAGFWLFQL
jgi:hypothetical protein